MAQIFFLDILISTYRPPMSHSRVGWIKPITEEHFHDIARIPSENFQESNLRGFVAQEVD